MTNQEAPPTELLPCPFCGGEAHETIGVRGDHGFAVRCGRSYCDCSTRGHPTRERANERWNTRTPSMGGELREEIADCLHNLPRYAKETGLSPDEVSGMQYAWSYVLASIDDRKEIADLLSKPSIETGGLEP